MQLAQVIGTVVATRKDPRLAGHTLLLLAPDGQVSGRPIVAVDSVGAGPGETVFFARGREASFPFLPEQVPTDVSIIGIVDHTSFDPSA